MNNAPLVSVLIPVYNCEKFIRESIESVLNQDYPNLELVISDDSSKDRTPEILEAIAKEYGSKIKLFIQKENLGVTGNCNFILKQIKGKYLALHAGDDVMLPGKIIKQVEILENNPSISICGSITSIINKDSEEVDVKKPNPSKKNYIYRLKDLIRSGNFLVPCASYIVRTKHIPAEGFDNRLPIASDSLFSYHIASHGDIYILNEKLTAYRIHETQISGRGYDDDSILSLALCEFYFPDCYKEIFAARAECMSQIGRRKAETKQYREANYYFKMSLRNRFKVKTFIFFALNCFHRIKRILCAE